MLSSSASLTINVCSATELVSVEHFGKQDPFLQFTLDFNQKDTYLRTFTHKNGGESATWNQTFTISLNGEPDLFIEVLDEEHTVNEVIGFAAIPINQIVYAPGAQMNGLFQIYDTKGNPAGLVNLQLAASGFPNSAPPNFGEFVRGQSYVNEEHCARMKSINKKATGVAVGGALLGGALAIGAGLLGKKLYDDHREEEEEEERLRQEEEERRRREREEFEEERNRFEQEKSEWQQPERRDDSEDRYDCSDDDDVRRWNPVGTYAAGDRVKYHGQVYMCLQGHTSNPTWQPDVAHSLWQAE
ncbi:uncharacterized protein BX663DRAFT_527197 [Cokeromyces recurvatus]|uniref:uncharacterized protein n=1 Tax=Cokeromyces recurvatus TaxID=90255 RepID=UPI00221F6B65|nr:uncharacterized protein BX663DRAFT_527197 [Cokeromyces recurvatus]KAI7897787.1 hypothetical protein BX663DRAFT_527197 [Cokeromyces recurvatus]